MAAPADVAVRAAPGHRAVAVYWATYLVLGLSLSILGPAIDQLRERSGADIGDIAVLFAGQSFGFLLGSLVAGRLYDRLTGHRVFAGALLTIAAGLAVVPSSSTLLPLFVAFVVVGAGAATVDVGGNTMLLWALGADGGRAMNVLHLCFGVGALSAPLVVYAGLDLAVRLAAVGCVALAVRAWTLPSPRVRAAEGEQETDSSWRVLALISTFFFVYVGLEVGFAGWIHSYGVESDFSSLGATWLTTTFWVGFTVGRVVSSAVAGSVRPRTVLVGACVASVVASAVLVVGHGRPAPAWIGAAMLGVAAAPQFPVMFVYLERRIHTTGSATGWFVAGAGLGGLLFPWLIGRWFGAWGPAAVPWSALLLAVATAGTFAVVDRSLGQPRR